MPSVRQRYCLPLLGLLLLSGALPGKEKPAHNPPVRWAEGNPGCTFSRDDDGKYRWSLWTDDVALILAVDSQELQMSRRRIQPFLGVVLTVRNRSTRKLELQPSKVTLEFVKHFHLVRHPMEASSFLAQIQRDADQTTDQTEHQIEKHPDQKEKKEELLRDYQKQVAELQEFVDKRSLRPAKLGSDKPEVTGWMLFGTKDKWLGEWKNPEEFVLHIPLEGRVFEFPFTLPPQKDDLILRRRSN